MTGPYVIMQKVATIGCGDIAVPTHEMRLFMTILSCVQTTRRNKPGRCPRRQCQETAIEEEAISWEKVVRWRRCPR